MASLNNAAAAVKTDSANARIDLLLARCAVEQDRACWVPLPQPYSFTLVEPQRYEPSAHDWQDYAEFAKDFNDRQFARQIEADEPEPTAISFALWIAVQAATYRQQDTPTSRWLAVKLDDLAKHARFLDATGPESYEDRDDCYRDSRSN